MKNRPDSLERGEVLASRRRRTCSKYPDRIPEPTVSSIAASLAAHTNTTQLCEFQPARATPWGGLADRLLRPWRRGRAAGDRNRDVNNGKEMKVHHHLAGQPRILRRRAEVTAGGAAGGGCALVCCGEAEEVDRWLPGRRPIDRVRAKPAAASWCTTGAATWVGRAVKSGLRPLARLLLAARLTPGAAYRGVESALGGAGHLRSGDGVLFPVGLSSLADRRPDIQPTRAIASATILPEETTRRRPADRQQATAVGPRRPLSTSSSREGACRRGLSPIGRLRKRRDTPDDPRWGIHLTGTRRWGRAQRSTSEKRRVCRREQPLHGRGAMSGSRVALTGIENVASNFRVMGTISTPQPTR